jgi:hypothetical protein
MIAGSDDAGKVIVIAAEVARALQAARHHDKVCRWIDMSKRV